MKTNRFLLAACVSLALAFTLSCSDGNSGGGGGSDSTDPIKKSKITGVFQKGPFVQGTLATLNELDYNLNPTGRQYQTLITDNKGTFELRNVELVSPYVHLIANGFYRNEVTGEISKAAITLQAITDITGKDNTNVNIITHLEYYRVLDLVDGGMTVKAAKQQAQKEIFAQFGINSDSFNSSEDMSIFGTTEGDAALLAISILLQGNSIWPFNGLGEGEFSQRLIDFSQAIRSGGAWNNDAAKNDIADWAHVWNNNLASIRSNILGWGLASDVPAFEKYIKNYWYMNYGLGECNASLQGSIKRTRENPTNILYYICRDNAWVPATEYERDTYQWVCSVKGEIRAGQASGKKYICEAESWRLASYIEVKCSENPCLTFTDIRDNRKYVYVEIGDQTWMAENLNYDVPDNATDVCNNNNSINCTFYGRLYNWETAKAVCPSGWHLPSDEEWTTLTNYAGGDYYIAWSKLKATSGWGDNINHGLDNGTDDYGFSALPGGYGRSGFSEAGVHEGVWWSSTEYNATDAWTRTYLPFCDRGDDRRDRCYLGKSYLSSVRCVRN